MKNLIAVILLAIGARAEIPLAVIAEFDLPYVAQDVEHWMDDSTYGWVGVVNPFMIKYETRIGDGIQTLNFGDSLCDSLNGGGHSFQLKRACIIKGNDNSVRFAVTCNVTPWSSQGLTTLMIIDPETARDTCLHFSNDRLFNGWPGSKSAGLYAWPPPPAATEKVFATTKLDTCDDWGNIHCYSKRRAVIADVISPRLEMDAANIYAVVPFAESGEFRCALAGLYKMTIDDDINPYDYNTSETLRSLGRFEADTSHIETTCYEYVDYNPQFGFVSVCSGAQLFAALQDTTRQRRAVVPTRIEVTDSVYVEGMKCYDVDTEEVLWDSVGFPPSYAICFHSGIGPAFCTRWLWGKFHLISPDDGHIIDSTSSTEGTVMRILNSESCVPEIVTIRNGTSNNWIYAVYKTSYPNTELSIVWTEDETVSLRWKRTPYATGYSVCRDYQYDDDLCDAESIFTTDTTMTLEPLAGRSRAFFTVVPIFD